MKRYNKGEWCEIFFLKGLYDERFIVKDNNENEVYDNDDQVCHRINKLFKNSCDKTIERIFEPNKINKDLYLNMINLLKEEISKNTGTFSIDALEKFSKEENFSLEKGSSYQKEDLKASITLKDNQYPIVFYSIKSKISASATLLNASNATNFRYKVFNLSSEQISEINNINTRTKLIDRIKKILEYQGNIEFIDAQYPTFSSNLNYIDGHLEKILGIMLLESYSSSDKNISTLIEKLNEKKSFKL